MGRTTNLRSFLGFSIIQQNIEDVFQRAINITTVHNNIEY